ncbi:hypothetical protein OCK74_27715 [Chitinophagaceae bacterium LB-8]|uniref:Uncharacterized protein n=1 Tax=Paraflavisolibacter caeni TaxID=2982496 RepID=A0A9X2Y2R8_9BACT|nr:hypothetical protein [Paraflavisolibacter caeni]MCU7552933.1 hypothetical protein [Paraflavisolibacter caeni]
MSLLNRSIVLNTMIKHETLIIHDIGKEVNLGFVPDKAHLQFFLDELTDSGYLSILDGVTPCTYTITAKGITEGKRLKEGI